LLLYLFVSRTKSFDRAPATGWRSYLGAMTAAKILGSIFHFAIGQSNHGNF
jgi:hypothetical protein